MHTGLVIGVARGPAPPYPLLCTQRPSSGLSAQPRPMTSIGGAGGEGGEGGGIGWDGGGVK